MKHMNADALSRKPSRKCKRPDCPDCGADVLLLDRDSDEPQRVDVANADRTREEDCCPLRLADESCSAKYVSEDAAGVVPISGTNESLDARTEEMDCWLGTKGISRAYMVSSQGCSPHGPRTGTMEQSRHPSEGSDSGNRLEGWDSAKHVEESLMDVGSGEPFNRKSPVIVPSGVDRTDKALTDRDVKDPSTEDNSVLPEATGERACTLQPLAPAARPVVEGCQAQSCEADWNCQCGAAGRLAELQDETCFLWKMEEMIGNLKAERENTIVTDSTGQDATLSDQQSGRVMAAKGQAKAAQGYRQSTSNWLDMWSRDQPRN